MGRFEIRSDSTFSGTRSYCRSENLERIYDRQYQDHDPAAENKTLYEQDNPDYIPSKHGGPSIVVSDSEHNRVIEFQRTESGWELSWEYKQGLNSPRDADRLQNGNTLVADSRDNELLEINSSGQVVRRVSIPLSYEAERFGSGPESEGGPSAGRAGLQSVAGESGQDPLLVTAKEFSPDRVLETSRSYCRSFSSLL